MSRKNKLKRQKLLQTNFPINPPKENNLAAVAQFLSDTKALLAGQQAPPSRTTEVIPPAMVKGLVAIATSAWRARSKMVDPMTGEPHEPIARVLKDINRIYRHLEEIGFRIRNHTGEAYDDGQPMTVVTSEPRPEAMRKYVLATLLPTSYWNDHIIQHGEYE